MRVLRVVVVAVSVAVLAATVLGRASRADWPFELLSNFPVQLGVAALGLLAAALVVRARAAAVLALGAAVLNVAVVGSTATAIHHDVPSGAERVLLAHLNAQSGHVDVAALRREVQGRQPHVFVVFDPAPRDVDALRAPPRGYVARLTRQRSKGPPRLVRTVVWSRVAVWDVRRPDGDAFGTSAVRFSFRLGGEHAAFLGFGSDSPTTPARAGDRNRTLHAAARWSRRTQADGIARRVVMGDLNATPWSPVFRRLLDRGRLHSSLDGFGIQPTWPVGNPLLLIPIDHALLSHSVAAVDRETGPSFGSDHRSLWVTVAAIAESRAG